MVAALCTAPPNSKKIGTMIRTSIFCAVFVFLAFVSRKSLVRPRSHGFPRFFAWVSLVALFLLVVPRWIDDWASPRQWVSWALITVSAYLALRGAYLLHTLGRPDPSRTGDELFPFERTSRLVDAGLYRHIRHPLYASLLFLAWGFYLKHPLRLELLLACSASFFLILAARIDEIECAAHFGDAYRAYMKSTRRFIPFLI